MAFETLKKSGLDVLLHLECLGTRHRQLEHRTPIVLLCVLIVIRDLLQLIRCLLLLALLLVVTLIVERLLLLLYALLRELRALEASIAAFDHKRLRVLRESFHGLLARPLAFAWHLIQLLCDSI